MLFGRRHTSPAESANYLVVGLGNIGPEYALTRHNMGFMILDSWAQESGIVFSPGRYGSTSSMMYKGRRIHLLKPSTYMNLSGNAVRYWQRKLKIPLANIIVICDDINLPFGTVRLRKGGSAGGHNGLEHIELCLGTKDYARIRLGIGKDFEQGGQIDYVLGRLSEQELEQIPALAVKILQGVREYCTVGADFAMNTLNIRTGKTNI